MVRPWLTKVVCRQKSHVFDTVSQYFPFGNQLSKQITLNFPIHVMESFSLIEFRKNTGMKPIAHPCADMFDDLLEMSAYY